MSENSSVEGEVQRGPKGAVRAVFTWRLGIKRPLKPGIYRTCRIGAVELPCSWSYWDGKRWRRFGSYVNYAENLDFLWRGTGKGCLVPFEGVN